LSTQGDGGLQEAKIILLIQFILPMLALVLGQTYEGDPGAVKCLAKACLFVVALMIPLQLLATWIQQLPFLSFYLYAFSVYQHFQYVPVVLVCAFVIACFSLWPDKVYRTALLSLAIPIGAYAMLSMSTLTVGGLLIGSVVFVAYRYLRKCGKDQKGPLLLLLMIAIGINGALPVVEGMFGGLGKASNVYERVEIWRFYIEEILSSGNILLLGHSSPPDREFYPSAHNYYLDFIYNFGLLALTPIVWLIAFTMWKSARHWKDISAKPEFFALTGVVLFLLIADNSLKVALRQPYPGVVTFFLWGVLLSRISMLGRAQGTHGTEG
jgi:O-antigen ligase